MRNDESSILKRSLERERKARKEAERILEEKSLELYHISQELKLANEKLKGNLNEKTEELQGVFHNLVDAYVLMDINGNILEMNHSAIELFGFNTSEEKKNVVQLIYQEDFEYAMASFGELLQKGSFSDYEARVYTFKKGVRNVHINASIIKNEDGIPVAAQGIVRDITEELKNQAEKKSLLRNLERTNRDLNDFAHMVSHDLKSPLRSMDTLVNWLKEDYADKLDAQAHKTFDALLEKLDKMDRLIEGVLDYSSIDKTNKALDEVKVESIVKEISGTIHVPDSVSIAMESPLPTLIGNKFRFLQLFQNLISNAVKNMDKAEGTIVISGEDRGTYLKFAVKDNGKGIPEAYREKIFEMFESLDDHEDATGIGLAIVKKVVEFYKGSIWLESEVGVGTTFYFTLEKPK